LHGFTLEFLLVDSSGKVDLEDMRKKLAEDVALVSVIYANNEIGTINPMQEIGQICREFNVPLHTDAVQAAAHLPMDTANQIADTISIGAHKFYGPKGVGALFLRAGVERLPIKTGGGQEYNLRAGTQNVPCIVGLAESFALAQSHTAGRAERLRQMRDYLIDGILSNIPHVKLSGHRTDRLPNHASFVFPGVNGNHLIMLLDGAGFACSSGSACKMGDPKPSGVLKALGYSNDWSLGSLRVTLGSGTTFDQLDAFLDVLPDLVKKAVV